MSGTLCSVLALHANVLELQLLTGPGKAHHISLRRISLTEDADLLWLEFRRLQLPLRVYLAMTISQAQGQTKARVGVYLPQHVFTHGQLYVALSRVGSAAAVDVLSPAHTRNIVFREVI